MCNDPVERTLVLNAAMDSSREHNGVETGRDYNVQGEKVEIRVPKGRELILAPGLKRVLITDYHIMVCCWDFAKYVFKTRRSSIVEGT
jgi:hypothetical protein